MMRIVPIRNEKDCVMLFVIIFRDISAFRQAVEDDFAGHSALGAFAAASDPGSSEWSILYTCVSMWIIGRYVSYYIGHLQVHSELHNHRFFIMYRRRMHTEIRGGIITHSE